jgi:hypothetical protein
VSNKLFSLKPLCFAALLAASAAANATITVYTSQSDFLAAVRNPGTDSYDDLAVGPLPVSLTRSAGPYSYMASAPNGLWGAGNAPDVWLSTSAQADTITFSNFSGGVSAFGGFFFATDLSGQFQPNGSMVLTDTDGFSLSYTLNNATENSFLGFVSDAPLATITLASAPGGGYWPTANNVVLAVPEPATYGMFLAGLGFLGLMARRRG